MHEVLHPENWKTPSGYANGVAASGRTIFVGGQIGWNGDQVFESDDFVDQFETVLRNILAILKEVDAGPEHLVRLTWYITDKREYLSRLREVGAAYREVFGKNYPAMAVVQVAGLMEDRAKIEIEATAVIPE